MAEQDALTDDQRRKVEEFVEEEEGAFNRYKGWLALFLTATAVASSAFHLFVASPWGIVRTDLLRGALILALLVIHRADQVWIAYVVMAVIVGAQAFFEPARTATIPNVTSADELLPANALSCNPNAGCEPRIVLLNRHSATEHVVGVFDLDTKAFISFNQVGKTTRVMLSLGPDNDALLRESLRRCWRIRLNLRQGRMLDSRQLNEVGRSLSGDPHRNLRAAEVQPA